MNGKSHVACAAAASVAAARLLGTVDPVLVAGAAVLCCAGSLLPDVDTPTSAAGRALRPVSRAMGALGISHRTLTHSLVGLALVGLACYGIAGLGAGEAAWWFLGGYGLHLVLDALSSQGVLWFWPLQRFSGRGARRYKKGHRGIYEVGSPAEYVLAGLFCGLCLIVPVVLSA